MFPPLNVPEMESTVVAPLMMVMLTESLVPGSPASLRMNVIVAPDAPL